MMNNFLNGMFGKVGNGMCRLSMSGGIAVKTSNGYKSYNVKTGRLTNCDNFAFDIDRISSLLFQQTKLVQVILYLQMEKPKCVIKVEKNMITAINYEDSTVENIIPERHVFMGNTYFYGKIVSLLGSNITKGKNGMNNIFKYMMLSQMMNGNGSTGTANNINSMLPFMMMGGNMGDMFDGMFDFDTVDDTNEINEVDAEEEE